MAHCQPAGGLVGRRHVVRLSPAVSGAASAAVGEPTDVWPSRRCRARGQAAVAASTRCRAQLLRARAAEGACAQGDNTPGLEARAALKYQPGVARAFLRGLECAPRQDHSERVLGLALARITPRALVRSPSRARASSAAAVSQADVESARG